MKDGLKLCTENMQLVFEKLVHGSDTKTHDSDARRLKDKKKKKTFSANKNTSDLSSKLVYF